jgi:hypothetical protein
MGRGPTCSLSSLSDRALTAECSSVMEMWRSFGGVSGSLAIGVSLFEVSSGAAGWTGCCSFLMITRERPRLRALAASSRLRRSDSNRDPSRWRIITIYKLKCAWLRSRQPEPPCRPPDARHKPDLPRQSPTVARHISAQRSFQFSRSKAGTKVALFDCAERNDQPKLESSGPARLRGREIHGKARRVLSRDQCVERSKGG